MPVLPAAGPKLQYELPAETTPEQAQMLDTAMAAALQAMLSLTGQAASAPPANTTHPAALDICGVITKAGAPCQLPAATCRHHRRNAVALEHADQPEDPSQATAEQELAPEPIAVARGAKRALKANDCPHCYAVGPACWITNDDAGTRCRNCNRRPPIPETAVA